MLKAMLGEAWLAMGANRLRSALTMLGWVAWGASWHDAIVTAIAVALFENYRIQWNGQFIFALGWLVLVLSLGAISLLNLLIRRGSAVNVASLFYLTPPTTALIAFFIFGENLSLTAAIGMLVANVP